MRYIWQGAGTAVALTAVSAVAALAQPAEGYYYGHHGMSGWDWLGGLVMMVLFVALVVGAVVFIFRLLGAGDGPGSRSTGSSGRALDILNQRFARGEIDRPEYEDRRKALEDDSRG